jgi:uncharacterized RmlC-like cupin family protein
MQVSNGTPTKSTGKICKLVRPGASTTGKQNLSYGLGISADSVGATGIHLQLVTLPPGSRALVHKHAGHESALYAISGTSHVWHGDALENHDIVAPGDFLYIPEDVPHLPYNPSATETVTAITARTDPNEQQSVVLLPHLESIHPI